MTTRSLWTDASSDLQALLRNAGAKLTAGTVKRALRTLNVNGCGAYREQALQEAYAEAGAGLLVCLTPPTDSRDAQSWLNDATKVLVPLFDDDPAGKMLFDTIVFQPGSLTAHLPALHTAWQEHVDGVPLTWKTDVDLPHALQAFVDTFEQAVDASPELRSFLLAARMKQATTNAHPQEVTTLVGIIERLAAQPQERRLFFTDLGRMGYSASGITVHDDTLGSLIVTDDNRTVFISDEGTLAWLFHQLPDHQQVLAEYRAHVYRTSTCVPLDGLGLPLVDGTPLDPDTLHIPLDEIPFPLYALTKDGPAQIPPPDILPTLLKAAIDDHAAPLIQGAPGSGKSALLRRLARAVASGHELLPVRVPLEQVDAAMEAGQPFMDAVLDVATAHKEKVEQKRLRAALAGERAAHHILWLWDGLDSVHAHHKDVVNALARLYTDGCRMIIASRPTSSPPLPFSNATYEMQAPTPETSADFVAGWCAAFAAARAIPPTERDQWVAECAGWVQTAIESRPTLHAALQHRLALAFLTALACDEPRSDPPAYRKDFYGKHIERLFDTYAAKIGRERDLLPGVTDPQQARHQLFSGLYRLALQQQKAGNGTLRMATYAEVKNALAAAFGQTGGLLGRFQASVRVKAFIDFWEHAGVLASCRLEEQEWLAFRHLAIQQYAAARALVRAHHDSPEALWAELAPYRQNARWRDVVSLALAQVDDADWVIEHVLKDGHATPDVVLFLAGLLNEGVQSTPTTRRYIVDALEQIITTTDCLEQREDAFDALTTIGLIDGETYVTQKLLAMICHEQEDAAIRYRAADVLNGLGRANELLDGACDDEVDGISRLRAAEALIHLGHIEAAMRAWRTLAHSKNASATIRVDTALQLNEMGQIDDASNALLELACDTQAGSAFRRQAVVTLNQLGRSAEVVQAWQALAHDDSLDPLVRQEAAEALDRLGQPQDALDAWATLAFDLEAPAYVRSTGAFQLLYAGQEDLAAQVLISLAQNDQVDLKVRQEATEALGHLGRNDEAMQVWMSLIQDSRMDGGARLNAAEGLLQLGETEKATTAFLALVRDKKVSLEIRKQAGEKLRNLGHIDDVAVAWLELALNEAANSQARLEAARSLEQMGCTEEAGTAFTALARDRAVSFETREQATDALGHIGLANEAVQAWLTIVQDEELEGQARLKAALALRRFDLQSTVEALIALAHDTRVNQWTRVEATKELVKLDQIEPAARLFTALAVNGKLAWWVRQGALRSLAQLGPPAAIPEVLSALEELAQDNTVNNELRGTARWVLKQMA